MQYSNEKITMLRRKQVEKRTGLSRSTIYNRMHEGTFPKQVSLGPRTVRWSENEINEWLAAHINKRDLEMEVQ